MVHSTGGKDLLIYVLQCSQCFTFFGDQLYYPKSRPVLLDAFTSLSHSKVVKYLLGNENCYTKRKIQNFI